MALIERMVSIGLAVGISLAPFDIAQAQTPEEFYKGKTVTVVISAPVATASDTIARVFIDHLRKHFPGKPSFVVQNKPGAGGLVAVTALQKSEKADGTVITLAQRNNFYTPLVTGKEEFDPRQVTWVGGIDNGDAGQTIVAIQTSPVQSAEDMFAKPMVIASTAFDSENRTIPAVMNRYFGTKFNIIPGYKGRGDIHLAMQRGEADGYLQSFNSLNTPEGGGQLMKEGKLKPIVAISMERNPAYPNLPTILEFAKSKEQVAVIKFLLASLDVGRAFAVPKAVPADRVAAIRQAFVDTFKDKDALAAMQKGLGVDVIQLITGPQLEQSVADIYGVTEETLKDVRAILTQTK